jgi:hypothetical protein
MATQNLPQLSFGGLAFPYQQIKTKGSLRRHVHLYPHSPGGAPEKLGRSLYVFSISSPFNADFLAPKYRQLWPSRKNQLVAMFEQGKTDDLLIPDIGSPVRAYCTNWETVLKSSNTSGVACDFEFEEDSEALRLLTNSFIASQGLTDARTALDDEIRAVPGLKRGLFDTIMFAIDDILAYKDQFDLYVSLIEAKCLSVIAMLRNITETMAELKDPSRWRIVDALMNIWREAKGIYDDLADKGLTISQRPTPRASMTLSQVSTWLFGYSSRGGELLTMNTLADPFDIPLGTVIRYYAT